MPDQVSFHTMRVPIPDLEALGLQYLRRRAAVPSFTESTDPIHILNPTEQAALRRIERSMVLRAAIAGALSGAVSAAAELIAIGPGPATTIGWLWVAGATLAATAMEIAYLYWDALRSVHDLAAAAGVRLFPPGVSISAMTATALARAALELPNRPDPRIPVNPYREASKAMLVTAAILYKLKIGLTNFLLKALIRRLGGRTLLRSWAPFVAVPVTALWNAWVARVVIHEARIRAMGPSATCERLDSLLQARSPLSPAGATCRSARCGLRGRGKTRSTPESRCAYRDAARAFGRARGADRRSTGIPRHAASTRTGGARRRDGASGVCTRSGRPPVPSGTAAVAAGPHRLRSEPGCTAPTLSAACLSRRSDTLLIWKARGGEDYREVEP